MPAVAERVEVSKKPGFPPESISTRKKHRMLDGDVQRIGDFLREFGVQLPQNSLDRVLLVGQNTFRRIKNAYGSTSNLSGFAAWNEDVGYVDGSRPNFVDRKTGGTMENRIRIDSAYVLLLSNTFRDSESDKPRFGIVMLKPEAEKNSNLEQRGAELLNEGVYDYIVDQTMYVKEGELKSAELYLVKYLVGKIGEGPLINALFTRIGYYLLIDAMEDKFGKDSFRLMVEHMGMEEIVNAIRRSQGNPAEYSGTIKFLNNLERAQQAA